MTLELIKYLQNEGLSNTALNQTGLSKMVPYTVQKKQNKFRIEKMCFIITRYNLFCYSIYFLLNEV